MFIPRTKKLEYTSASQADCANFWQAFVVLVVVVFRHRLAIGSSATRLSVLFRANSASENTQTTVASTSNEGARKCAEALDDDDDEDDDEDQERISSRCGKTHARNVSRTRTRASRSASDEKNNEDDDIIIAVVLLLLLLLL